MDTWENESPGREGGTLPNQVNQMSPRLCSQSHSIDNLSTACIGLYVSALHNMQGFIKAKKALVCRLRLGGGG